MDRDDLMIREMVASDVPEVVRIEKESFSDPWPASLFYDDVRSGDSYPLVVQLDNEIVAFAILWVAVDEGHITNIAVSKKYQRKSVARTLLSYILRLAAGMKLAQIVLEVRASNEPAISLYESFGFEPLAIRKRYYQHPVEDALVMRKVVAPAHN
jgi:[ribosomal protein S18]-alanine N-acetyltransferase